MRRSTSALSMGVEEYRPDDLEEFWVSDVPIVHAARVIRPCALDRLLLDAELPQDSAHSRWLHPEQCRQFQDRDSHFGNLLWRSWVVVLYGGNFPFIPPQDHLLFACTVV